MRILRKIFDFYLDGSIHVAFAVIALFQMTVLQFNIPQYSDLSFFIFFGTIVGYNSLKYFQVFWYRIYTIRKNFSLFFVTLFSFLVALFFFLKFNSSIQFQFIQILFLILLYPLIRKFWILKMIYVSLCITIITVVIAFQNFSLDAVYFLQRFLLVFCLLIPLEIGDITADSKTIITMPIAIGINNLKYIGYILIAVFLAVNFDIANLYISLILVVVIFFSFECQSKYFSSFWMDLLPIFFYALIFYLE
jgi:hypothetical protein